MVVQNNLIFMLCAALLVSVLTELLLLVGLCSHVLIFKLILTVFCLCRFSLPFTFPQKLSTGRSAWIQRR